MPIVPTGTIRCTLTGEALSIAARSSSDRRSQVGLLAEPEFGSGAPHPVENNSQLASHRDASASHAARLRDLHAPGAQDRPFAASHQERVGGLVQRRAGQFVAASADLALNVGLARLVARRRQAEVRAYSPRSPKAVRLVDGGAEGE